MPDWSYQPCFRPLLFRLLPRTAQAIAIGCLGRLGSFSIGRWVIRFMGHMSPDKELAFQFRETIFTSRVGLCAGLDSNAIALGGFDQFGLAFLEYGPLTIQAQAVSEVQFSAEEETVTLSSPEQNPGVQVMQRLRKCLVDENTSTPILIRFDPSVPAAEINRTMLEYGNAQFGFVIPSRCAEDVAREAAESFELTSQETITTPIRLMLVSPAETEMGLPDEFYDGVLIDGSISESRGYRQMSAANLGETQDAVARWKERLENGKLLVATGGVHQPLDALRLQAAGADIVGVDSGMVIAGPGLPKRCNELIAQTAFAEQQPKITVDADSDERRLPRQSWFWAFAMGISMLLGGLLALVVALTRVILPYDEGVVGMTRDELIQVNDRLLDFMAHDRVTLAGTMLCVGTLYSALAWFAIRFGTHWARDAVVWSAFVGFCTFFLFLGFGYFDPFHAFVTTILFQFLLLTVYARLTKRPNPIRLDPYNDAKWKRAQWGQLLYLIQGVVLVLAGVVISKIGISAVFVPEDMEFLCTTREKLIEANPQLLSLVAHDRATFGGMLICAGTTLFLSVLWGFRRGHAWLWWTLFVSGLFGFLCTIAIHHRIGYTSLRHLLPAYGGLLWQLFASALCFSYLHNRITHVELEKGDGRSFGDWDLVFSVASVPLPRFEAMPRQNRSDEAGVIYHALNRGNDRETIFKKRPDYEASIRIVDEGLRKYDVELFAFTLIPTKLNSSKPNLSPVASSPSRKRP